MSKTIYLKDYQKPEFAIESIHLQVDIQNEVTVVTTQLLLHYQGPQAAPTLVLQGVDVELVSLTLNGELLAATRYQQEGENLSIAQVPTEKFTLTSVVKIYPEKNTALEGLYASKGMYCTQCEAEGFRKITYYLDRPDVMSVFTTTIRADKTRYPVLLSNGNCIEQGDLADGRHFATWHDPFPKPSYLFALVAGDLAYQQDEFITASGRKVDLRIYVEAFDLPKVQHAMDSLKKSMRWDEQAYGREYDLDIFMIVAVSHFNMGAMENKGLNIFNTSCVLAHPDTTSDIGFQRVESVVAHEYFHNWSGNRVTCRDWFQLSLKEGFTVYRDQHFSSDLLSASVQRIEDVNGLRLHQFSEDAGPLAHPVRPDSFVEINNFYTSTVYEKGAEIVRMIETVLGRDKFRKGSDQYFSRHDGQAVTVEDFIQAMSDGSQTDVSAFMQWYQQPGTPTVKVSYQADAEQKTLSVVFQQQLPALEKFPAPKPLPIPVRLALLNAQGQEIPLSDKIAADKVLRYISATEVVLLLQAEQEEYIFQNINEPVVASIFRDFSAPVYVQQEIPQSQYYFLLQHDANGVNRWLVAQDLFSKEILRLADLVLKQQPLQVDQSLVAIVGDLMPKVATQDESLCAKLLQLPTTLSLFDKCPQPDAVETARQFLRQQISASLETWFADILAKPYQSAYHYTDAAMGTRQLRNTILHYLVDYDTRDHTQGYHTKAYQQYQQAEHMTDRAAALTALVHARSAYAADCLQDFKQRYAQEALVIDQWFAIQATVPDATTIAEVKKLLQHPEYYRNNPNRVRSVLGQFANNNPVAFHQAQGEGYRLLTEEIAHIDALNPQLASRLMSAMSAWKRLDAERKDHAQQALTKLSQHANISTDLQENLTRLLA